MAKRKNDHGKMSEKAKVIHIENYRRKIEQLRKEDGENLRPKTSRKISQINKQIKKLA